MALENLEAFKTHLVLVVCRQVSLEVIDRLSAHPQCSSILSLCLSSFSCRCDQTLRQMQLKYGLLLAQDWGVWPIVLQESRQQEPEFTVVHRAGGLKEAGTWISCHIMSTLRTTESNECTQLFSSFSTYIVQDPSSGAELPASINRIKIIPPKPNSEVILDSLKMTFTAITQCVPSTTVMEEGRRPSLCRQASSCWLNIAWVVWL